MPGIDFALLRRQVPLTQVLDLLGFRPTTRCGPQVRGPCPLHGSPSPRSRSFAAHLQRHCWRCFRCGAGGNALDLYAAATRLPLYEASLELCRRLGLTPPWLTPLRPP
jgi:DNA primase